MPAEGGPGSRSGGEGRRGRRVLVDLDAVIGGRTRRSARVADLSLVGCLVRMDTALSKGAVVDLTLELPDGPLRVKARAAASSLDGEAPSGAPGYLAGLEFLALGPVDEARLRAYVEAEAKRRRVAHTPPA
jgi:PilZ domain